MPTGPPPPPGPPPGPLPGPPPGPAPGPPPDPALVCRASSSFFCGSSLSSAFSFQNPASVFLGSTSGFFFAGGAGGGGGSGCEGGKGRGGACAERCPEGKRQTPQRTATQPIALNLGKIMFSLPPRSRPPAVHPDRCQKFQIELLLCRATEVYYQAQVRPMETVLIIEDSRPMQRTLQRLFEADSLGVRIASDGEEGLESLRNEPPNAV